MMVTDVAVGDETSVDITGGKVPIEVYITYIRIHGCKP